MPLRRPPEGWRSTLLAMQAWLALAITQLGLKFWRFQAVRRILSRVTRIGAKAPGQSFQSGTLIWAVRAAGRRFPFRKTCLGEALVAEALLIRHGYYPTLCIGAARREGHFEAHAWLEQGDAVLIGGPVSKIEEYTRFPEISSLAL